MYEKEVTEVEQLIQKQNQWRDNCINLIASENVLSQRARSQAGSDFAHRYAEGHPGERYYRGTSFIDDIENQLKTNLKILFECDHSEVRPISGTNANEAFFSRFVNPGAVVMVNSTPAGGHISHHREGSLGKFTKNVIDIPLTADGYHMDVAKTTYLIEKARPKLIVLGKSLFLFPEPIAEIAEVCQRYNTKIMYDAAHVLGLIAGKRFQRPLLEGAYLMTASTHKTYFGSQRGIILSNMEEDQWRRIDRGAFPGSSSNHHLDTLAQMAVCTYEFMEFGEQYAADTIKNAKALATELDRHGFDVQGKEFGFTETHQVAVNVRDFRSGEKVSKTLEINDIILNMNMLPHEPLKNHDRPDGIRIGVQEMTRVGMGEQEMGRIAELIKECIVDKKTVIEEVNRFRSKYQEVRYSYDKIKQEKSQPAKSEELKN
ncbi:Serine hydroxymethyltransferase (tetrahydromethanopterin-dependent) [Olavius sp. associated proteobacterium Delta 1]|nr:Serine hydroxymethyltransferase (tetrahydromethanopterin-dependent) [Olavius sp. associated proteobacterium Delta 1]